MNKEYISRRAMNTLIIIKRKLMEDNDLATKVSESGSLVVAYHIDEIMCGIMKMETDLYDYKITLKAKVEENEDYMNLLCGYSADMLSDEVREKIGILMAEWGKEDDTCD